MTPAYCCACATRAKQVFAKATERFTGLRYPRPTHNHALPLPATERRGFCHSGPPVSSSSSLGGKPGPVMLSTTADSCSHSPGCRRPRNEVTKCKNVTWP